MRLIGNKTRLLGHIEGFLRDRGVQAGTLIDIFSGTASVGRHFKALGFRVLANDRLAACHAKSVAEVEVSRWPACAGVLKRYADVVRSRSFERTFSHQTNPFLGGKRGDEASVPLGRTLHLVDHCLAPREGTIFRNYAPGGGKGRMYFTDENARRIDAVLEFLREGHREGFLARDELFLVLSSLLDAADRVANISGTYGAFLKRWQRNALQPLELRMPEVITSTLQHRAYQRDANELIRELRGDVLYIDPPYNKRQYAANYHVLDVIAEHHSIEDLDAYEAALYGKTGLRPWDALKSDYCVSPSPRSRGRDVLGAMTDLILSSRAHHVLVSYDEEGLLRREELGNILARFAGGHAFDFARDMRSVLYKRFCSDSDRAGAGERGRRSYRVLDGKQRGETDEWLLYAARGKGRASRRGKAADRAPEPAGDIL